MALRKIAGDGLHIINIQKKNVNRFGIFSKNFKEYVCSFSRQECCDILQKLSSEKFTIVVVDGSNLGYIAKQIKTTLPNIKVVTQCHNVEWLFFLKGFLVTWRVKLFFQAVINFFREINSLKFSDQVLCLTENDRKIFQIFGEQKKIIVSPLFLPDASQKNPTQWRCREGIGGTDAVLFIGSNFYGNIHGLQWYLDNVHYRTNKKLLVAGIDRSKLSGEPRIFERVIFLGFHEDISELYDGVIAAISPIFVGSGMKTKVAEAMSYGLPIIGTCHSFIGYDHEARQLNYCCKSREDFINAVNFIPPPTPQSRILLRRCFVERYSVEAGSKVFHSCLFEAAD